MVIGTSLRIASGMLLSIVVTCQALPFDGPKTARSFSAARALEHARKLVSFGPRPSGSDAIRKAQDYIEGELKSYGLNVVEDVFTAATPTGPVAMKNIIGQLQGAKREIIAITGHYDTKRQPGFVGANDGGSSAATVLELARVLAKSNPGFTLWFVFFDGEEAVVDWNEMNGMDNTYGSRHLAARLVEEGQIQNLKAMLLVDMIGDRKLNIKREGESTRWLIDLIWDTARSVGFSHVFVQAEQFISDDHLPFKNAGVPVADIIDFEFGGPENRYWHTNADTLDKISGESMKAVGDVIVSVLPKLFKRLERGVPAIKKPAQSGKSIQSSL